MVNERLTGSEVACVIRGLLPEFAHLEKRPFMNEPATITSSQKPSDQPAPPPTVPVRQLPLTPPPTSAESSTMAQKRSASGGKFQFWYIGTSFTMAVADDAHAQMRRASELSTYTRRWSD